MEKDSQGGKSLWRLEEITRSLQNYIIDCELSPGDPLPSEKELSKRLQVSRTLLREALQRFKVMGMIESKRKSGMVLKRLHPENLFEPFIPFIDPAKAFDKLLEMRMILEMGMVEALVAKTDSQRLLELEILAMRMRESRGRDETVDLDNAFHGALFETVGNEFLDAVKGLSVDFFSMTYERNDSPAVCRSNYENHMGIVEALRSRNYESLRTAFKKHYKVYAGRDL